MALNIRNPEAEQLAEEVARLTGESKTEAGTQALRDRLDRLRRERSNRAAHFRDSAKGGIRPKVVYFLFKDDPVPRHLKPGSSR